MKVVNIETETFNRILRELRASGWTKVGDYDDADDNNDEGVVVLMKDGTNLRFEWSNWSAGTVIGPDALVREIRGRYLLRR